MRPLVKPALRRVWRGPDTLQLGLDPRRAVVLDGVGPTATRLLAALDGTRDRAGVLAAGATLGVPPADAERLLDLLHHAGALDDGAASRRAVAALPPLERDRLEPDLAALSLLTDCPDAVLARRRATVVEVRGAGRVGAQVAVLLAAAGVGHVSVVDEQPVRCADMSPGGIRFADRGRTRGRAAGNAVRRAAPGTCTDPLGADRPPDLTVLATATPTADRHELLRRGAVHLHVGLVETTGVIGPLVLPGRTPCLRCIDLARAERDPAWPQVAAQLAVRRERSGEPCDVVLATVVAGHAVLQALAHVDGSLTAAPVPPSVAGTLELALPDWRLRRRSWSAHPACGCQWEDGTPTGAREGQ